MVICCAVIGEILVINRIARTFINMKPYLSLIFLTFFALGAKAQLGIISDPDGFVNVRKEHSATSAIVGKLYNNQVFLFYTESDKDEWIDVSFDRSGLEIYNQDYLKKFPKYVSGFIHRSRLLALADLTHKKLNRQNRILTSNLSVIKIDSIAVTIKTRAFNRKNHDIHRAKEDCGNCSTTYIDKIDGKKPVGVDGELPSVEIGSFKININHIDIELPASCFTDIYQPRIKNLNIYSDKKGNLYLYMPGNSDGAGGYDVVWVINGGKLALRYVDGVG